MSFIQRAKCRTCESSLLKVILDLGLQPLANAIRPNRGSAGEIRYPLRLVHCEACGLVQIDVDVNANLMFSDYNWVTSTSSSTIQHCKNFVAESIKKSQINCASILEVGSNDGSLLNEYAKAGLEILVGVEPAWNLSSEYENGIMAENLFFSLKTADSILNKYGCFDVVVARNVFSHIPDFFDVIAGVSTLIFDDSVFFMEFHWAYEILQGVHYDSIYHEHSYYHSISSVIQALNKFNLKAFDVFKSPISGGSLVLAVSKKARTLSFDLQEFRQIEAQHRVEEYATWQQFGTKSLENISQLRDLIESFSSKRICAFGASARSSTILNSVGITANKILSIGENNPRKWGRYSPGFEIPIEPVEKMLSRNPDLIILFPFNFKDEILSQLLKMNWSGLVVIPIPHPPELIEL